ncbi:MAG TPA: protein kinase [Bryobacteraceae bacterium]|nr:protein kinase [Bryobacteraceae bacterium]
MPLSPGDKLGPYEILARIGAGGMGEVWKARDTRLNRLVAIKTSQEGFSERFEQEAHAISALNHPHICQLYDVGPDYLVMEYIEGTALTGRLPLPQVLKYAAQISDALDAAHRKGITHRDLKPANILVTKSGIKLLDFGLAKLHSASPVSQAPSANTLTMAITGKHEIVGTLQYMSPEQLQAQPGGEEVDARSDIFSFGALLYEMLTGQRVFEGPSTASVIAAIIERPAPSVAALAPPSLDRLLQRCLAKHPDDRWQTARDLKAELEWIAQELRDPPKQPIPSSRRSRWLWLAAVASLVLVTAAWSLTRFRKPSDLQHEWRFQISLPADLRLSAYGSFALSPDGRLLAYFAANPEGVYHLWIRSQESLEARQVSGTDMVESTRAGAPRPPFWSPDSRFVAYGFNGKLVKVDVAGGGLPQFVGSIPDAATGGSWNADGVILLGNNQGPLLKVSSEGGTPSPITFVDPAFKERNHGYPVFLPDGKHFLYMRVGRAREHVGIYVGSIENKPEAQPANRLIESFSNAVFVPGSNSVGELLFLSEGRLLAQRFHCGRLELMGQPVSVADQIGSFGTYGFFAASVNHVLIYRVANWTSQLKWFDRQGKILGVVGEPAVYWPGIALAPDDSKVAVSRDGDIWLHEFARGVSTRLTLGMGFNRNPIWSPDGARVTYSSSRAGAGDLYRKYANGTGEDELLLKSDPAKFPSSWSPDERSLLYTVGANEDRSLWRLSHVDVAGKAESIPFVQSHSVAEKGYYSPNNRWIAYVSAESGRSEVYVQTLEAGSSGGQGKWIVSKGGGTNPRWRRDTKELYYLATDGTVMAVDIQGNGSFQPGAPHALFQGPPRSVARSGNDSSPSYDVTADGKRFLFLVPDLDNSRVPFTVLLNWKVQ